MKRYRVEFEIAADGFAQACVKARELVPSDVVFVVKECAPLKVDPRPPWSAAVDGELAGMPVEVMLTFDPERKRGSVMLFHVNRTEQETTAVYFRPRAVRELAQAVGRWPEDVVASLATEDVLARITGRRRVIP